MELSEILNSLGPQTEKTASAVEDSSLSAAIDRALSHEKVASHTEQSPSADLMKIASDLSNAEQDALIKEAHIYGRAVADGFASRMSEYNLNSSVSTQTKTASFAQDPMVKHAMELGYRDTINALRRNNSSRRTKTASHNQVKTAQQHHYARGYRNTVKVASYFKGQSDVVKVAQYLEKTASEYREFGYKKGTKILSRLF